MPRPARLAPHRPALLLRPGPAPEASLQVGVRLGLVCKFQDSGQSLRSAANNGVDF